MTKKKENPRGDIPQTQQNEINEQYGFSNIYPSNEIRLYYLLEFAKRYLLEPISWVERPSTMPKCIKELNAEPLVVLYEGKRLFDNCIRNELDFYNKPLAEKEFIRLDNKIKPEFAIENLKNSIYSYYNPDSKAKERGLSNQEWVNFGKNIMHDYFAKNNTQAITIMINDLRFHVFFSLGIVTTNSIIYDDHEKEILKCKKDIQELRDCISQTATPNQQIIMALYEEVRGKVLIVRNEKYPRYYMRNKDFTPRNHGKWFEVAEKRIKDKGLKKPNWAELGRNYIRKEDGTEYKNFIKEIKRW